MEFKEDYRPEVLLPKLFALLDGMRDDRLQALMRYIFSPENLLDKFLQSPAARRAHHACNGGLAYHSIHAAYLGKDIARHYNKLDIRVNEDMVVAGVLLHDIGKIFCYTWTTETREETYHGETKTVEEPGYGYSRTAELHHHIPLGYREIYRIALKFNETRERKEHRIDEKKLDKLLHIILSHHGKIAWSSPVIPKTTEAYLVHAVEMLDGYVDKYSAGKIPRRIYD